jgi:DNA-binding NarL/FixJ family response regulator
MAYAEHQMDVRYRRTSDVVEVALVEDNGLFRQGLGELLTLEDPMIQVVASFETAEEAVASIPELVPDVALMDLHLPTMSGVEAIRRLAVLAPRTRLLVLSGSGEDQDVMEALLAGACGYLLKSSPVMEIAAGLRTATEGGATLSPPVASQLLEHVRRTGPGPTVAAEPVGQLTPREGEVLRLMATGLENSEIAHALVISERTARNHVASILEKLQMRNRIQAAVYAVKHGLA